MAAISDYTSLKLEIGKWLYRETDTDIDDRAATFVSLGEARIRRNQEWFARLYSLVNGGNPLTVTGNPTQLPSLKQVTAMWASTADWKHTIEVVTPELWRDLAASNRDAGGIPTKALIVPEMDTFLTGANTGPQLYLWPAPTLASTTFAIDFRYIADMPSLSVASPTTPLLTRHPDLYLYAALAESAPYYQAEERLQIWEQRYQQIVNEVNIERERAEYSASAKAVRFPPGRVF